MVTFVSTSPIKLALQVSDATLYGLNLTGGQVDHIFTSCSFLEQITEEGGDLWDEYLDHPGKTSEELRTESLTIPVPDDAGLIFVDYRSGKILSMNTVSLPGIIPSWFFKEEDPTEEGPWPRPDLLEHIKNHRVTCNAPTWKGRISVNSWVQGRDLAQEHSGCRFYLDLAPWELQVFPWNLEGAREFALEVGRLLPRPLSSEEVQAWEAWAKRTFELEAGETFFPEEPGEW